MTPRTEIFVQIDAERAYQQQRWGDTTDDTKNTPWMWVAYIARYATSWMVGSFPPIKRAETDSFRKFMLKVATIAVAAIESIDRQRATNGKTFYEEN